MSAEMKVQPGAGAVRADEGVLVRMAIGFTLWAERWFPDAFIFVAIAVVVVSLAALGNGATPLAVSRAFGDGFWSLIPFTMQMTFVVIGGYVVATSAPAQRLIRSFAAIPKNGISAVGLVAAVSMLASLLNWGLSLIFGGLLVRTLAERRELKMDYRAAAAAAYLGLGATWAMGLSSSAAQLQANAGSLPKPLLPITGVIPFSETIFLWQSMVITAVLLVISVIIAMSSAPGPATAVTAEAMGIEVSSEDVVKVAPPTKPGEWLEHSPVLTILLVLLAAGWIAYEFTRQEAVIAISNLNTYNFIFIMAGLLLHWRPKRFLTAVGGTGHRGRAHPVSALRRHRDDYHPGEKRRRGDGVRPDRPRLRQRGDSAHVSAADRHLLRHSGLLHPVRRRQVAAGSALRDAGGERSESASRLGGADL
jgi:short-chain fatty acids transporter